MGQLEAHRSMNDVPKPDYKARSARTSVPSIIHSNETRHDIVERGARRGILDRKEKEMSRGISTLPLRYIVPIPCRMCKL